MKKMRLLFSLILIFTSCIGDSKATFQDKVITDTINSNNDTIQGIKTLKEFYLKFYGSDTIFDDENLKKNLFLNAL